MEAPKFDLGDELANREKPSTKPPKRKPAIKGLTCDELEKQFSAEIHWLWRNHVPGAEPSMINAREGDGKTTVCLQIAKEVLDTHTEGLVVWVATEGAVKNTLAKMKTIGLTTDRFLVAQKANGDFLFNFAYFRDVKDLDVFLGALETRVLAVFIDSLRGATRLDDNDSRIGKIMHQVNSVVCDKHNSALVYIHHFNKSGQGSLLDRSTGTTAASAAVRHILSITRKSKFVRRIQVAKSNIDDTLPELEAVKIKGQIVIHEPELQSDESLAGKAEEFLLGLFAERQKITAREIYEAGEEQGLTGSILKKVKPNLGIESVRDCGRWFWVFPFSPHNLCPLYPLDDKCLKSQETKGHKSRDTEGKNFKGHKGDKSHKRDKGDSKKESIPYCDCSSDEGLLDFDRDSLEDRIPEQLKGRIDPGLAKEIYGEG